MENCPSGDDNYYCSDDESFDGLENEDSCLNCASSRGPSTRVLDIILFTITTCPCRSWRGISSGFSGALQCRCLLRMILESFEVVSLVFLSFCDSDESVGFSTYWYSCMVTVIFQIFCPCRCSDRGKDFFTSLSGGKDLSLGHRYHVERCFVHCSVMGFLLLLKTLNLHNETNK